MTPARASALAFAALLASTLLIAKVGLAERPPDAELIRVERHVGVMGTDLQIKVLGRDRARLEAAVDAADRELRRVEDMMTDWRPSPLTRLNDAAGQGPFDVPAELAAIVARAIEVSRITEGAFDVTYAGVGRLWDFKAKPPRIPDRKQIEAGLRLVGSSRLEVDPERHAVALPRGMRVGLGGIAKGYGVDRAMQVLLDLGIEHAIVNAGGDLKALGRNGDAPWEIAVKHPRDPEHVIAVLRVSNTAMVTSGDYERFFEHEGRRYHHILDPRTGYPSEGAMSATVIAPHAELADALATALCVMGPERGLPLIEALRRVEAIVIDMAGNPHATSGLRDSLE
ncbi:MAG: FAD:protein FMN transferase [Myxococcota bacterium]|nr:FAD:protein FMN transferase [Myxococcota bacterium]